MNNFDSLAPYVPQTIYIVEVREDVDDDYELDLPKDVLEALEKSPEEALKKLKELEKKALLEQSLAIRWMTQAGQASSKLLLPAHMMAALMAAIQKRLARQGAEKLQGKDPFRLLFSATHSVKEKLAITISNLAAYIAKAIFAPAHVLTTFNSWAVKQAEALYAAKVQPVLVKLAQISLAPVISLKNGIESIIQRVQTVSEKVVEKAKETLKEIAKWVDVKTAPARDWAYKQTEKVLEAVQVVKEQIVQQIAKAVPVIQRTVEIASVILVPFNALRDQAYQGAQRIFTAYRKNLVKVQQFFSNTGSWVREKTAAMYELVRKPIEAISTAVYRVVKEMSEFLWNWLAAWIKRVWKKILVISRGIYRLFRVYLPQLLRAIGRYFWRKFREALPL